MAETTEPTTTETTTEREDRFARAEMIVEHEWAQFQEVNNTGGRAECQDNWPTFHQMRLCQFLTWPAAALMSYSLDLDAADATGRNLLTEKYARMMVTTEPERDLAATAAARPRPGGQAGGHHRESGRVGAGFRGAVSAARCRDAHHHDGAGHARGHFA